MAVPSYSSDISPLESGRRGRVGRVGGGLGVKMKSMLPT